MIILNQVVMRKQSNGEVKEFSLPPRIIFVEQKVKMRDLHHRIFEHVLPLLENGETFEKVFQNLLKPEQSVKPEQKNDQLDDSIPYKIEFKAIFDNENHANIDANNADCCLICSAKDCQNCSIPYVEN